MTTQKAKDTTFAVRTLLGLMFDLTVLEESVGDIQTKIFAMA
jgi:hypothetical protein